MCWSMISMRFIVPCRVRTTERSYGLNFAEKKMVRFYIVPEFYRDVKKSMVMEVMESDPIADGPPRAFRNPPITGS